MDELISAAVQALAAAAAKKNAPAQPAQGAPPAAAPVQAGPFVPAAPQAPRSAKRPKETAHDMEEARIALRQSGPLSGLFEDGNSLLRAVVAAELLGPPVAMRENQLWQIRRPNERST